MATTLKSNIMKLHLQRYGFDQLFLDTFERPTEMQLRNLEALVDKLYEIRARGEKILVLSDFDGDGIMSGIIGYAGLSELGFNVELYHPLPAAGYGIHFEDIDRIMREHPDCKIILTADVGIGENAAITYAQQNGFRVLVTDHHIGKTDCAAELSVDPSASGEAYDHKGICGAHVLWMVLHNFAVKYESPVRISDIWRLRVFAGIATISDVMPLMYENRQLVRDAISIAQYYYTYDINDMGITPPMYSQAYSMCFAGLKQLLWYFEKEGKIKRVEDITEHFFAFYLVPMLNAVKRMDGDMAALYDIFFGQCVHADPDYPEMACVDNAISYVADLNEKRKLLVDEKYRELIEAMEKTKLGIPSEITKYADCNVYCMDIPGGICGLIAVKVMNATNMPCLVLYKNPDTGAWNGSGRSPAWFPFIDKTMADGFCKADGHNPAFGVKFESEADFDRYCEYYRANIAPQREAAMANMKDCSIHLTMGGYAKGFQVDFIFDPQEVRDFLDDEKLLHPYGQAFPDVEFKLLVPTIEYAEYFGTLKNHVKFITPDGSVEFLWFNSLVDFELMLNKNTEGKAYELCGKFQVNSYNGALNFIISDMAVCEG